MLHVQNVVKEKSNVTEDNRVVRIACAGEANVFFPEL
jgi:hypothetical protein